MQNTDKMAEAAKEKICQVSIIIPCYEEAENIIPLCTRLHAATTSANFTTEVLFIDDFSPHKLKGSAATSSNLNNFISNNNIKSNSSQKFSAKVVTRLPSEGRGLSSAVLKGFTLCKYEVVVVMDADLQHPPEAVVPLTRMFYSRPEIKFVFGSRNTQDGEYSSESMTFYRLLVSKTATLLATPLNYKVDVTDPMSGFFATRKHLVVNVAGKIRPELSPVGYKIGLEILVKSGSNTADRYSEVPIVFGERHKGESKLTMKQYFLYIAHLGKLYFFVFPITTICLIVSGMIMLVATISILLSQL